MQINLNVGFKHSIFINILRKFSQLFYLLKNFSEKFFQWINLIFTNVLLEI